MQIKMLSTLLILLAINFSTADKFSFEGYHLIRLLPTTSLHIDFLIVAQNNPEFDFWTGIKGLNKDVDVLLSPSTYQTYKVKFEAINLPFQVIDHNIQEKTDKQRRTMKTNRAGSIVGMIYRQSSSIVGTFARYTEMMSFIDDVVAANPTIASQYIAGQTYEKRNLKVIVLNTTTSQRKIWLDCGIHAREWVSPATCIWIINKLVTEYNDNVQSTVDLLNYYEFHIMPSMNPDGYEYSHNTYRYWRKNRKPNTGSSCVGTDLNRNYGYKWLTGGSSSSPCSDTFAGSSANSELETKAVQSAINAHLGEWDSYLTVHSYGLWWFTTWGYSTDLPSNYADQVAKAKIGVNALQSVYKTKGWVVGSSAEILYIASGGSEDWAAGVAGIKYANCIELRPGQTGTDSDYGFAIPENRAPLVGEETYQGIKAFLASIKSENA